MVFCNVTGCSLVIRVEVFSALEMEASGYFAIFDPTCPATECIMYYRLQRNLMNRCVITNYKMYPVF
jgi:hypothetical protein